MRVCGLCGIEPPGHAAALMSPGPRRDSALLLYFASQQAPPAQSCNRVARPGFQSGSAHRAKPGASGGGRSEVKGEGRYFRPGGHERSSPPDALGPRRCERSRSPDGLGPHRRLTESVTRRSRPAQTSDARSFLHRPRHPRHVILDEERVDEGHRQRAEQRAGHQRAPVVHVAFHQLGDHAHGQGLDLAR